MRVPSFDLTEQNRLLRDELMPAIEEVVAGGMFILGEEVSSFEKAIAEYCGVKHAIGVANGSDALYIALAACGIGPGDEVITTPFTFFATAGSICRTGATPVFADINLETFNIDPEEIEKKITSRTKAILPVHLYGLPADMDSINDIAKRHNLRVIEDAAQAIGSQYHGRPCGSLGDAGCISFFPTKNLGAFGDAGMVVTNDDKIADLCRVLRVHGARKKYYHDMMGINSRLDALQAKILHLKLKYLDGWIEKRRAIAARYTSRINGRMSLDMGGALKTGASIRLPSEPSGCKHVYHQYTIRVEGPEGERDRLKDYLQAQGIGSTVYYPVPLHLQKVFSHLGYKEGDFPNSETASKTVLSLPMFPEMTQEQIDYVVQSVNNFRLKEAQGKGEM